MNLFTLKLCSTT